MKKLLYLLLVTPIIYLASCSSGKENLTPEPLPIEETIVGVTWQLLNVGGGWFRLNEDYTYSTKDYLCDTFAIEGTWSLDGDIISNTYFIGAAQFVERSTIIQYSDSLLQFQADTTPTADVYIWFEACEPEPIRGCMDSTFLNFNPNAQCSDTCMNAPVYGCMDANALNYNATANIDDGSCCYIGGCMDATALNYDPNACQDDGSCCYDCTYVPDDNFEYYLENNSMGNGVLNDNIVLTDNIEAITMLNLNGQNIADLTGIEDFTALENLNCQNNQITSLDVSDNTALTDLDCSDNQITSIYFGLPNYGQNTALTFLDCSNNQLTSLDLTLLPYLISLDCSNNQLTSLDVSHWSGGFTSLTSLDCSNNQLTNLFLHTNGQYNSILSNFSAINNPSLFCISVDDVSWANANWTNIDLQSFFSLACW